LQDATGVHIATANPSAVLELVSMIRERDAVLRQALEALEGCAEYTALIDDFTLHASKQAVKAINEVLK
jgi:hypothetical protein